MSNDWKYADLGERERLDLIRKGNSDVYNYEKNRNAKYKGNLIISGLPTTRADEWEATIDNAYNVSKENARRVVTPKYSSAKLGAVNKALSDSIKELKKQRDEETALVNDDAESALAYLEEWLASNGYSKDGKFATESKKALNDALKSALEEIKKNYETQVNSTRSKYLSMVQ